MLYTVHLLQSQIVLYLTWCSRVELYMQCCAEDVTGAQLALSQNPSTSANYLAAANQ